MERRDTLRGVIDRNGVDYEEFARALREAYPDKEFPDRVIQRYLRQPLRLNYAIAAGVGQDKVLAIVREVKRGRPAKAASAFVPEESVDAMLARHGLDRREASGLWLDPMTSLELFEGLTGLGAAETRKMCIALSLTHKKPFIPQPEQTVPEDVEPPSIVAQIDMRQAVNEALAVPEGEVLRDTPAPRRHSLFFRNASDRMLRTGRDEIARLGLTREPLRQLYETRDVDSIRARYGWSEEKFYILLGLLDIPLRGNGPRPSDVAPAPWPDSLAEAASAEEPEPDLIDVGRALIEQARNEHAVSSNGTAPIEPAPPSVDAASATIAAMRARRRFVEERMVERRAELDALSAEYEQLRVAMEAMEALRAYYVPPQG